MSAELEAPSRFVLEEIESRAFKFLSGVSRSRVIRSVLAQHGYTLEVHKQGRQLLLEASGFLVEESPSEDANVNEAIASLDVCDEKYFRLIHAAVDRAHPDVAAFLFSGGLVPSTGEVAVLGWQKMLDRIDTLKSSEERKATRKADLAALKDIELRGLNATERARLRALVETATVPDEIEAFPVNVSAASEKHTRKLVALYDWFYAWSETARVVITRRDQQIRLGLAKRKAGPKKGAKGEAADKKGAVVEAKDGAVAGVNGSPA